MPPPLAAAPHPAHYQPAGFAMIRAPLLPVGPLHDLFMQAAIPPTDPAGTGGSIEAATAATHAALYEVAANPLVQEALLVSSSELFQGLRYWEQDPTSKKGRRAAISLLRYVTRMSTRATPFGLAAGVGYGVVGPAMDVRFGPRSAYRKHTHPDLQWLLYQVRRLEARPAVAARLPFTPNPAMLIAGDRLHIPYRAGHGQNEPDQTVSLRATPVQDLELPA